MKKSIFLLCCTIFACGSLQAQTLGRQVVAAGGKTTATPALSLSWTVGEAIVGLANGAGLSINQGFQQSETPITALDEVSDFSKTLALRVYPNPTTGLLHLERLSDPNAAWRIRLFSAEGRELAFNPIMPVGTTLLSVNLSSLPAGQYFLHIQGETPEATGVVAFQKGN